jgi:MFS family permease
VFFVWASVFNLFVIAVFWSFMADLFDKEQGKRLFAFITAGASVGGMLGSAITAFLAKSVGEVNLLLVSAVLLAATLSRCVTSSAGARGRRRGASASRSADRRQPVRRIEARPVFALPRRHRGVRVPDVGRHDGALPAAGGAAQDLLPRRRTRARASSGASSSR